MARATGSAACVGRAVERARRAARSPRRVARHCETHVIERDDTVLDRRIVPRDLVRSLAPCARRAGRGTRRCRRRRNRSGRDCRRRCAASRRRRHGGHRRPARLRIAEHDVRRGVRRRLGRHEPLRQLRDGVHRGANLCERRVRRMRHRAHGMQRQLRRSHDRRDELRRMRTRLWCGHLRGRRVSVHDAGDRLQRDMPGRQRGQRELRLVRTRLRQRSHLRRRHVRVSVGHRGLRRFLRRSGHRRRELRYVRARLWTRFLLGRGVPVRSAHRLRERVHVDRARPDELRLVRSRLQRRGIMLGWNVRLPGAGGALSLELHHRRVPVAMPALRVAIGSPRERIDRRATGRWS